MTVDCRVDGQIGFMTLNRPAALNALSLDMIDTMTAHLLLWKADPQVRAVVIQAVPGKAFCAGGDIRQIYALRGQLAEQVQFFEREYRLNQLIHDYPKPYIALMDGITMGGGVGVSLHGSHRVASEGFVFAMPETAIGFFPDIGASNILARCPGAFGYYLGLTGDRIKVDDALALGLVSSKVVSEDFPKLVHALGSLDLAKHPHRRVDACLASFSQPPASSTLINQHRDIEDCFVPDSMERIMDRLINHPDVWFHDVYQRLIQKSPLSLKVTLQLLRVAKHKNLNVCLELDRRLVRHFLQDHDFYEGVRAVVVDKDQQPDWQPASLAAVSAQMVSHYFECV